MPKPWDRAGFISSRRWFAWRPVWCADVRRYAWGRFLRCELVGWREADLFRPVYAYSFRGASEPPGAGMWNIAFTGSIDD